MNYLDLDKLAEHFGWSDKERIDNAETYRQALEEISWRPCEKKGYECTDLGFIGPYSRGDMCPSCIAREVLMATQTQCANFTNSERR